MTEKACEHEETHNGVWYSLFWGTVLALSGGGIAHTEDIGASLTLAATIGAIVSPLALYNIWRKH